MYSDNESVKLDYDVSAFVFEENLYESNFVWCYTAVLDDVEFTVD